ncbi:hypothetical protein [Paraburkholderia pallida]|uniref:GAF domain-containing protein n=1 Tax=Paraburkholderia pallida TaxID=2547399 RepID=A0A4P7CQN9_9BURK|nr:hypothetical protein [Paraburkholderia pallida]QBQ98155.1 hypothetical protein E1956_13880 [Paraburkholderia pallida]
MVKPIPGPDRTPWYFTKAATEGLGSGAPAVAAILSAIRLLEDPATKVFGLISAGAAVWLIAAALVKIFAARAQDKKEAPERTHEGLRAALFALHSMVAHAAELDPDDAKTKLRVTFHRVVPPLKTAVEIQQLVDYVGGPGGGDGRGRTFSIRSGIAGKAARTRSVYAQSRVNTDIASYEAELREHWGYTEADSRNVSRDSFAWMSVPICDATGQHALGVVYLDSTEKDLFASNEVRDAIVVICGGIAAYVGERYK